MAEVRVDLHCPACGHEVFRILEDGFHCTRCGHQAQPYCALDLAAKVTEPRPRAQSTKKAVIAR